MRAVVVAAFLAGCMVPAPALDLHDALLAPGPYNAIVVELDHDVAPDPAAWQLFLSELQHITGKPILEPPAGPLPPHADRLRRADLSTLHEATAQHRPGPDRLHGGHGLAYLHVLYLSGGLEADTATDAAGGTISRSQGLLVVFPDAFQGAVRLEGGELVPAAADIERTVLLHELGHAFGLVDRGVPMQVPREDDRHDGHSDNEYSVMHHGARIGADGILRGPVPDGFDAFDLLDLDAYKRHLRDGAS